jgi:hypothetical protein
MFAGCHFYVFRQSIASIRSLAQLRFNLPSPFSMSRNFRVRIEQGIEVTYGDNITSGVYNGKPKHGLKNPLSSQFASALGEEMMANISPMPVSKREFSEELKLWNSIFQSSNSNDQQMPALSLSKDTDSAWRAYENSELVAKDAKR